MAGSESLFSKTDALLKMKELSRFKESSSTGAQIPGFGSFVGLVAQLLSDGAI